MIVGFTITDFKGREKEAISFIQKVCFLESPDVAENIVNAGPGVNIYANGLTKELLDSQQFSYTPIETQDGKILLISLVNFNLELQYNNKVLRLRPTEYVYVEPRDFPQFVEYLKQGLVKTIPTINGSYSEWILEGGTWDDEGIWDDSNCWKDVAYE